MATPSSRSLLQKQLAILLVAVLLLPQVFGVVAALPQGTLLDARPGVSPAQENTTNVSASNATATIESMSLDSPVVFDHNGSKAVWKSNPLAVSATLRTEGTDLAYFDVCLRDNGPGGNTTLVGCNRAGVKDTGTTVRFDVDMNNTTAGRHRMVIRANNSIGNDTDFQNPGVTNVTVLRQSGDIDQDQLTNLEEFEAGLNLTNPDTDGDGLTDGQEVNVHGTDPGSKDTDLDTVPDNVEVNGKSNATLRDTDDDGLGDALELERGLDPSSPNSDQDNLSDARELVEGTDPLQADTDDDGLDDGRELELGTDPTTADTDSDGVLDGREVDLGLNPLQADTDGDGIHDGLEQMIGFNPRSSLDVLLTALGILGVVIGAGVLLYRTDRITVRNAAIIPDSTESTDEAVTPATTGEQDTEETPSSAPATNGTGTEMPEPGEPPVELLTPSDRVKRILSEHDGHVPQSDIVEETDWSKAKVSRTLSKMEEEDEISRYRLGRGNIVTPPGADPTAMSNDGDDT